jgi:GNAT superfamily N-acetyltransferase
VGLPSWSSAEYGRRLRAQEAWQLVQVVAWDEDVPVGKGHVLFPGHEQWSISAHRWNCPEVRDVFVAPGYRRRGIATAVMGELEDAVRDRGMSRIGLAVAQDEEAGPAQALYERLGYVVAHGPFVATTTLQADDGPKHVGAVFVYVTKEL